MFRQYPELNCPIGRINHPYLTIYAGCVIRVSLYPLAHEMCFSTRINYGHNLAVMHMLFDVKLVYVTTALDLYAKCHHVIICALPFLREPSSNTMLLTAHLR